MKKYSSILLLSFSLLSGVAMAGGTTEAGIGGALGGVLGSVVGNSIGGSTGGAIGAGLGGAEVAPWAQTNASVVRPLSAARWALQVVTWSVAPWAAPRVATLARQPAVVPVVRWVTTWAKRPTKTITAMAAAIVAATTTTVVTGTVVTTMATASTSATGATNA